MKMFPAGAFGVFCVGDTGSCRTTYEVLRSTCDKLLDTMNLACLSSVLCPWKMAICSSL